MRPKQDDDLDKLEEDIRRLKNKYDQFFSGIQKMPPMTDRRNVEVYIHELNKLKMRDNTRRFRFNTLLSRYNQYREMWGRRMREREEGPLDFKRRQAALEAERSAPPPPEAPPQSGGRVTSSGADPYVRVAAGTNGDDIRRLYDQLTQEHGKLGTRPNMTFEQLTDMITKQGEAVRSRYHVDTVGFRVETVDGKVKLKAKPLQD
ncbi:MAG TPA: MXAN_5187 C-terminal domain-containing protein [Thermoanaerobaculia bacterium]|nr:MXAN_5187 C-terminal domain-containing protein [Thermoanaerobaculia bacterium]